jgi:hypothetical protein
MVWVRVIPATICFAAILLISGTHAQLRPPATGTPSGSSAAAPPAAPRQISNVTFTMAASDRLPNAARKTATLSFRAASAIPAGGGITIMFPSIIFPSRISLGDAPAFAGDVQTSSQPPAPICISGSAPTDCSVQGKYLMSTFSDICPSNGFYFAPFGLLPNGCPKDVFNMFCQPGLLPAICSDASKMVAALPDACPSGSYFAPDVDAVTKCPAVPQSTPDDSTPRCAMGAAPLDCSIQAQYIMFWFGSVCPFGSYFAPGGIQSDGCPIIQDMQCVSGAVPSGCSELSRKISAIPSVCPYGHFAAPFGLNPASKCPDAPSYAAGLHWPTALTSGSAGATSVSFATFQNANISIGSMRYECVLVVMAASSIPSGKQTPKAAFSFQHTVLVTPPAQASSS